MLGNLIGGFIAILVGASLIPTVADGVAGAIYWNGNATLQNSTNVTGAAATITGLTTLFFSLGIVATGIAVAAQGLKSAGLLKI